MKTFLIPVEIGLLFDTLPGRMKILGVILGV